MIRTSSGLARLLGSPWVWLAVGLLVRIFHVASLGNRYYFGDTSEYEIAALRLLHSGRLEGNSVRAPARAERIPGARTSFLGPLPQRSCSANQPSTAPGTLTGNGPSGGMSVRPCFRKCSRVSDWRERPEPV